MTSGIRGLKSVKKQGTGELFLGTLGAYKWALLASLGLISGLSWHPWGLISGPDRPPWGLISSPDRPPWGLISRIPGGLVGSLGGLGEGTWEG